MTNAEYLAKRRAEAAAGGYCPRCLKRDRKPKPGCTQCVECLYNRQLCDERATDAGLCGQCHKRPRHQGLMLCEHCRGIDRSTQRRRYAVRAAAGLCRVYSCKNQRTPGKASCQGCRK
jgi:hypothetical protein